MAMNHNGADIQTVALQYHAEGFSVIACRADKRPTGQWQHFTVKRAKKSEITRWFGELGYQSIGVVLGEISHKVVVVDLDGLKAVKCFHNRFPQITENTRAILTGSQQGIHLYFKVSEVPQNINVRVEGIGGFELRGNGQYVIAPPSPHPSGHRYTVYREKPILYLNPEQIVDICAWFESLRTSTQTKQNEVIQQSARPTAIQAPERKQAFLETIVSQEIARVETASKGNRNDSLFYAALRLANYAAGGELIWSEMSNKLSLAARRVGLPTREAERTIQSAWHIGSQHPRKVK